MHEVRDGGRRQRAGVGRNWCGGLSAQALGLILALGVGGLGAVAQESAPAAQQDQGTNGSAGPAHNATAAPASHAVRQQEESNPLLSKKQDHLLEGQSGFLGDLYPRLQPARGDKNWLIWLRDPGVMSRANAFYLDRVQIMLAPQVQKQEIPQQDLDKLADTFGKDMREELTKGNYKVVDQPGPGVMTLRFALTNIEPNGGKTNAVVSGSEAVATHALAPGVGMLIPRLKVGKAAVEGEMVDSQSGQVEMAFMTSKSGRRVFSGLKAFEKWGDIDAAFKAWAKSFRERLDKAHKDNSF